MNRYDREKIERRKDNIDKRNEETMDEDRLVELAQKAGYKIADTQFHDTSFGTFEVRDWVDKHGKAIGEAEVFRLCNSKNEETLDELRLRALEECHYLKRMPAGDEGYYWCELSDHPCSIEYDGKYADCEEYEDFVKELLDNKIEEAYNKKKGG